MFGPRTTVIIRKSTETDADGGYSLEWSNVQTIRKARVRSFTMTERLEFGKDTTTENKKCYIPYHAVKAANRQYMDPKYRIQIDDVDYAIESAELRDGSGKHYELLLQKVS